MSPLAPFAVAPLLLLAAPEPPFPVGQPFPTLALPSLEDGRLVAVQAFRGRKVLLHVFASW